MPSGKAMETDADSPQNVDHNGHQASVSGVQPAVPEVQASEESASAQSEVVIGEDGGSEGLLFATAQEAWDWYRRYAHSEGFGVRNRWGLKRPNLQFVCNKEGETNEPTPGHDNRKTKRPALRNNCGALCRLHLNEMKTWYRVTLWVKEHNHVLHPPEFRHMLKSNRRVSEVQGLVAKMNMDCGLTLRSTVELMARAAGGRQYLGFTPKDMKNHLGKKRQSDMLHGEATSMYNYFREQSRKDQRFYWDVQVDIDEKTTNIFWADGRMIADYTSFGDCITFDTTFRTNDKYRPLGLFAGFNHHHQICLFGAALLYDESSASFEWLFRTFKKCMRAKGGPQTIFTDQCAAMPSAIKVALPETYHALCTWHLLENGLKHMGAKLFKECDLETLMYVVSSGEDFDAALEMLKERCFPDGISKDSWLDRALLIKEQWCSAWVQQHFTAGMHMTQLSESTNAVLRGYLKPDHNIAEFFTHFERVVESRRAAEFEQEFRAANQVQNVMFPHSPLVRSTAEHYTPTMFVKFQNEYMHVAAYVVQIAPDRCSDDEVFRVYTMNRAIMQPTDIRFVCVRVENITLACSCRYYESFGMLCRHILAVMEYLRAGGNTQMMVIPPHYIMKRWTKKARCDFDGRGAAAAAGGSNHVNAYGPSQRYQNMCAMAVNLFHAVYMDEEASRFTEEKLREAMMQVQVIVKSQPATQTPKSCCSINEDTSRPVAKGFKQKRSPNKSRKRQRSIIEERRTESRAVIDRRIVRKKSCAQSLDGCDTRPNT